MERFIYINSESRGLLGRLEIGSGKIWAEFEFERAQSYSAVSRIGNDRFSETHGYYGMNTCLNLGRKM